MAGCITPPHRSLFSYNSTPQSVCVCVCEMTNCELCVIHRRSVWSGTNCSLSWCRKRNRRRADKLILFSFTCYFISLSRALALPKTCCISAGSVLQLSGLGLVYISDRCTVLQKEELLIQYFHTRILSCGENRNPMPVQSDISIEYYNA